MNRRQKLVQQQFLNNEKTVIKRLQYIYDGALSDINKKIRELEFHIGDLTEEYDWLEDDDPKKEIIRSKIQSKIYQKQYQESLQDQVGGILKQMQTKQYLTISDYLDECYTDGFVGSLFDLHGQNVPLLMPLDQTKMVRAVQLDSKISKGLYTRLGEDVATLKKRITAEVTRSVATGTSYAQCAQRLAGQTKIGYNKAVRIARTEGHRIQTTAAMDVMESAKEKGADVLKQWDAALDDRTRESHQAVDGEIREVDKPFSNGLMFPGDPAGGAAEVVNCRCALLQRARWALDEDELEHLKERAEFFGLDKADQFDDFKKKYLKAVAEPEPVKTTFTPAKSIKEAEDFAKQFADSVDFAGAKDLDAVNEVNRTLQMLQDRCPVDKLASISTNSRLTRAEAQANYKALEIGTKWLNNIKNEQPVDWAARVVKNKEKIAQYIGFTDPKKYPRDTVKTYTKFIKKLEEECKYSRWTVSSSHSVAGTIVHEYGHILADQYFGQINHTRANGHFNFVRDNPLWLQDQYVTDVFNMAKKNGDIQNISMYAATDDGEFFAETFSMHIMGEPLPDYIEEMVKKVISDVKL